MNTKPLEKFAQNARRQLHSQIAAKLERVLTTDSAELRAKASTVQELQRQVKEHGKQAVVERVAYTWFNRFCALRYMDANRYTRIGIVSPAPGNTQPEILQEAKAGLIDPDVQPFVDERAILDLLGGRTPAPDPQQEAYRLLLVGACNSYHGTMPFLFEPIDHYTELLMPDDLLSQNSILHGVREALTEETCRDVEVIGWLYQFYISEKKDQVIGSKRKITPENIPAATQLFTPHWIVRYLVENSLGRLWMLNRPASRLVDRMEYYIDPSLGEKGKLSVASGQSSVNGSDVDENTDNWQPTTDYLQVDSPEEIRLCDPAAGSGHMLTYAFDLLHAIYEEEGYAPSDIPRLILEKNLYGMEIDERAGALAAFALTMKAREKDRRFFRREVRPNICVLRPIQLTEKEVKPEVERLVEAVASSQGSVASDQRGNRQLATDDRHLITDHLLHDLTLFAEADNFGSLLRPRLRPKQITAARAALEQTSQQQGDLFAQDVRDRMRRALDQAGYLARKYHVVVANPPYMGSGNMNARLKKFAQDHYSKSKSDLFAMFIERNLELARHNGMVAMITMQNWMFLSSFEKLRTKLLEQDTILSMAHLGARAFDTIGGEVVSTTAFVLERARRPNYKGAYLRLVDGDSEAEKATMFRENLPSATCHLPPAFFRAAAADFKKIPGSPIAYWLGHFEIFDRPKIEDLFVSGGRLKTHNGQEYIRYIWEVARPSQRWKRIIKGGEFRKYFGHEIFLADWSADALAFYQEKGGLPTKKFLEQKGICWSKITSSSTSFRIKNDYTEYDAASPTIFLRPNCKQSYEGILAYFNSFVVRHLLAGINPTLNTQVGDVLSLPIPAEHKLNDFVESNTAKLIIQSKLDWDAYETSWDFTDLPLLRPAFRSATLADTYAALRAHWREMTLEMQRLEEENNRIFIDAYGLQDELTPDVPLAEITLTCNPHYRYSSQSSVDSGQWSVISSQWPEVSEQLEQIAAEMAPETLAEVRLGLEQKLLADTMREFISYAVGCMFGRYSLDKPGLILANQGETVEDYVEKVVSSQKSVASGSSGGTDNWQLATDYSEQITFMPDTDNVIPMLDGDWFADDIVERFKRFLRVTFGEERYAENLAFVEAALGRDVRSYFLREFYDDHLKRYQKRPIYWLFSSPRGSFNALIYMHRYRPDTVSVVLNDYLREFRTKLTARKQHLEGVSISAGASQRDKTRALKDIDKIDKILAELQVYEDEILYPLATQQVQIDLDDGVKVNYAKFGDALKNVRGLS